MNMLLSVLRTLRQAGNELETAFGNESATLEPSFSHIQFETQSAKQLSLRPLEMQVAEIQ